MPRTRFAQELSDAYRALQEDTAPEARPNSWIDSRMEKGLSRREFLRLSSLAPAALALPPLQGSSQTAPRIVVVGAGLAGLTCALRLRQAGYAAQIYEASNRVGGRCWTLYGAFDDGQIVERGGELIDQGHTAIRHLAQELGLKLDNVLQAEAKGTEMCSYFDGAPYTFRQATDDLKTIWMKLHSDLSKASYPTTFDNFTPRGYELDQMSIVDYINETVPGGINSNLGQLLDVAYNIEYGAESDQQSALNLLYLLGYSGPGRLRIFGPSNEKYHVMGGNDQIVTRLAGALPGQITLGHELIAVKQNTDGTYRLTFKRGGGPKLEVTADKVVLALPFSIMRQSVDYKKAGFSALKQTAIMEMGMGTNSKLHVQFADRHWNGLGCNGETFADTGYQNSWEVTRAQPGGAGILVNYTGGSIGASFNTGTPAGRAQQFLSQIEPVLPGITAKWNGKATLDYWTGYEWTKGSYSYWKVGQYTKFGGIEGRAEGNCHFAGEHTSKDFQGYLNGAVETGERAAKEITVALS